MATLPRGTVTFLFTDIEGFTRLMESARDAATGTVAAQRALAQHGWPDVTEVTVPMASTGELTVGDQGHHGLDLVRA